MPSGFSVTPSPFCIELNVRYPITFMAFERRVSTMPFIQITFKVSEEIARGLADGRYRLFGAVVRDNSGRVVKMLQPILTQSTRATRMPRIAIAAVAVAAVAGGAIYLGSRLTRKARLTRQLAKVDRAIQPILVEHRTELTRDDLCRIRTSIDAFLRATDDSAYHGVSLTLPDDAKRTLIAFAEALQSFSVEVQAIGHLTEPVPELPLTPVALELVPILKSIHAQLAYQDRNWPTQ